MNRISTEVIFLVLSLMFLFMILIPLIDAQQEDLQILNNHFGHGNPDYFGGKFHVTGEVQNIGSSIQNNVRVRTILYNKTGGVMVISQSGIYADHLLPLQKAPFKVSTDFYYQPGYNVSDVDSYDIEIVDSTPVDDWQYQDLEIVSNSSYIYEGPIGDDPVGAKYYVVEGAVKNTGSTVATGVRVMATFYNASGVVLDTRWEYIHSDMPYSANPEETVDFTIYCFESQFVNNITSYSLLVQSTRHIIPEFPYVAVLALPLVAMIIVVVLFRWKFNKI